MQQVVIRIEEAQMTLLARAGMRRTAAFETEHLKIGTGQFVAESDTEFTCSEICDAANLVYRFVTWAAGDDNFHGMVRPATGCFKLRTSTCNCRASSLRCVLPSRSSVKPTVARTARLLNRLTRCGTSVMSFQ